ncbi:hypothetical protein LZS85_04555 [Aliivibrio fischeri]|uniref:hypothetical protein n=1 Tax=Aliivibrio fischeri TaxID=668 RepID=UPI001F3380C2|nr:hypothetical protein [Aliivibrio fischeri]MCE7565369.1 hypothetical protein [Aliivibrio fischeri]
MTAQISEILIYNGEKVRLHSAPNIPEQHPHIRLDTSQPEFISTACWRGYVGTWKITNRKLYLNTIKGKYIVTNPVLADWYCGTLVIPESEPGEYFHGGWGYVYAKNKLITIVNGEVTNIRYQDKKATGYIDDWAKQRLNQTFGAIAEAAQELYLLPDDNDKENRLIVFTFDQKTVLETMTGKLVLAVQDSKQFLPISACLAQPCKVGGNHSHNLSVRIPALWAVDLEQTFSFHHRYNSDDNIIENIDVTWFFSKKEKPKMSNAQDEPLMDFDDDISF